MDGGSTDGSTDLLAASQAPGLRWWSEPDDGQSDAINKAFEHSSGEIIGWLNSDDAYFDRRVVSRVVRAFRDRPDVDVVYGHAALVNADGRILQAMWAPPFRHRLLPAFNFVIQPTAFIRRSAIESAVLVDAGYHSAMDRELWLRLSRSSRFLRLPTVVAIDRHQPGRKVYTRPDLAARDTAALRETYGIPIGRGTVAARKVLKVAFRVAGITLIRQIAVADLAFGGRRDRWWRLMIRQVALPRAAMPMEG